MTHDGSQAVFHMTSIHHRRHFCTLCFCFRWRAGRHTQQKSNFLTTSTVLAASIAVGLLAVSGSYLALDSVQHKVGRCESSSRCVLFLTVRDRLPSQQQLQICQPSALARTAPIQAVSVLRKYILVVPARRSNLRLCLQSCPHFRWRQRHSAIIPLSSFCACVSGD